MRFLVSHQLLREWCEFALDGAPFAFAQDIEVLCEKRSVTVTSWRAYSEAADFGAGKDQRFHLGLYPLPFIGNLERAKVVLLLLNPGLGADDYYGEYEVAGFRDRLRANIRQDVTTKYPFFLLDPDLAWHSGYTWWHGRLQEIISELSRAWTVSHAEARKRVAHEIAALELVPYHSASYGLAPSAQSRLHSATLARKYCDEVLVPRCADGNVTLIVTRRVKDWGVDAGKGAVIYEKSEPRAALIGPQSRGGRRMLEALR